MPKERHHILLARRSLEVLIETGAAVSFDEQTESAYFLGALSPDTLFYDPPSFSLSPQGTALHRLVGQTGTGPFRQWIAEEGDRLSRFDRAWILGFAGHFLADSFWHPLINDLDSLRHGFDPKLRLSSRDFHHWIESELEAHWMSALGPPDGFLPLIERLSEEIATSTTHAERLRAFLKRCGLKEIPRVEKIRRCYRIQLILLRLFASSGAARLKPLLLWMPKTRYLGALIVPRSPVLPGMANKAASDGEAGLNPCDGGFMARSVMFLSSRLSELPAQL